jgi:hypothetical protein
MEPQQSPRNLVCCLNCRHRSPPPYQGVVRCVASGRNIREHVDANDCPENLFASAPDIPVHFAKEMDGPGTELVEMLKQMADGDDCPTCPLRAAQMNIWGVKGCREHFDEIVGWLQESADKLNLIQYLAAGAKAAATGLPLTIPGLVTEAIRRCEAKQSAAKNGA